MHRRTATLNRVIALILSAAVAVSGFAASPAPASAVDSAARAISPFGMNSHMLWGYSDATIDREMDALQAAGVTWLRIDVSWHGFEPTAKGAYSSSLLAKLDYIVAQARAHGIELAPTVIAVPKWANDGLSRWNPPTNDADFGDFMRFIAARYAGKITYWELGNEVNETGNWNVPRAQSPARYVSFLKAGNAGVKAGNPAAKVITAGLAGADFGYVREMYAAGAQGHFDIVGIHPYGGGSPYTERPDYPGRCFSGMAIVKQVMDENGDSAKKIWATEIGWGTGTSDKAYTEAQQAQYTYEAFQRLYAEFPYVETMFIYGLRDQGTDLNLLLDNYGLLKKDYTAKPAYAAYRKAYDEFQKPATAAAPIVKAKPVVRTSRTKVARNSTITLRGTVSTSILNSAGEVTVSSVQQSPVRVKLQRKKGTRWVTVKTIVTSASGAFKTRAKMTRRGTARYRVVVPATTASLAGVSKSVAVKVR